MSQETVWDKLKAAKSKYNRIKNELDTAVKNCIKSMIADKKLSNHMVIAGNQDPVSDEAMCGKVEGSKIVLCPACCNKFETAFHKDGEVS